MSNQFTPRLDILPPDQIALWPQLHQTRDLGFVLYGGTAIALWLGHRQSVDFDFFSSDDLNKEELRRCLPFLAMSEVLQDAKNTLSVRTNEGVKVSFFGGLAFGRYGLTATTADEVLAVASLEDLLALKIKVIFERSEAKDYTDIAAMLKAGGSLAKGIAIAEEMFRPQLSPVIAVKALTYFQGGDLDFLSEGDKAVLIKEAALITQFPPVSKISGSLEEEAGEAIS